MGRKKKNRVYVGIDGIDIKVNTTTILEQNYYAFKNKNGEEIGTLKAVKDGYLLHLCLLLIGSYTMHIRNLIRKAMNYYMKVWKVP